MKSSVIFIIELVLFFALNVILLSFVFTFYQKTKKNKYIKKYLNKILLISIFSILEASSIPLLIGMLGVFIWWTDVIWANVVFTILVLLLLFIVAGLLFFMLQYIAIGITDTHIEFLGEKIELNKIYQLNVNEKKLRYYIHYYEGRRGQKKYSFKMNSMAYSFIIENENLLKEKMLIEADKVLHESNSNNDK